MSFTSLPSTAIAAGKAVPYTMFDNIKSNEDYLYGQLTGSMQAGSLVNNGGFEVDVDADGQPDNWTITPYTGGGSTLITTATSWASPVHGDKTLCITRPAGAGNGGAAVLSDYIPISDITGLYGDLILYANATGVHNKVGIQLYDANKVYTTGATLYDSTSEQTTPRILSFCMDPSTSTSARFARLRLDLGTTDLASSAAIYVDNVRLNLAPPSQPYQYMSTFSGDSHSATWANLGSINIEAPYSNSTMLLEINYRYTVTIVNGSGTTEQVSHRCVCGTWSTSLVGISSPNTTSREGLAELRIPTIGGPLTITHQGYAGSTNATVAAATLNGRIACRVLALDI